METKNGRGLLAANQPPATAETVSNNIPQNNKKVKRNVNIDTEALYERAAIIEYDGGLPRQEAEKLTAELYGLTPEQKAFYFPVRAMQ
jgi:hypothetical protein